MNIESLKQHSMSKIKSVREIMGEYYDRLDRGDSPIHDIYKWLQDTLTQRDQELLTIIEGMKQKEKALNGEYIELDTELNFALDDIKKLISNEE